MFSCIDYITSPVKHKILSDNVVVFKTAEITGTIIQLLLQLLKITYHLHQTK